MGKIADLLKKIISRPSGEVISSLDSFLERVETERGTAVNIYPGINPVPLARVGAGPIGIRPVFFLRYESITSIGKIDYQESVDPDVFTRSPRKNTDGGLALLVAAESRATRISSQYPDLDVNVYAQQGPLSADIRSAIMQYVKPARKLEPNYNL